MFCGVFLLLWFFFGGGNLLEGVADLTLGMAIEITSDLRNQTEHTFCIDWTAFKFPTTIKLREKHPLGF